MREPILAIGNHEVIISRFRTRAPVPFGPIALDDAEKYEFAHLIPRKSHDFAALPAQNAHREDKHPQAAVSPRRVHQADACDNRPEEDKEVQQSACRRPSGKLKTTAKVEIIGDGAAHDKRNARNRLAGGMRARDIEDLVGYPQSSHRFAQFDRPVGSVAQFFFQGFAAR